MNLWRQTAQISPEYQSFLASTSLALSSSSTTVPTAALSLTLSSSYASSETSSSSTSSAVPAACTHASSSTIAVPATSSLTLSSSSETSTARPSPSSSVQKSAFYNDRSAVLKLLFARGEEHAISLLKSILATQDVRMLLNPEPSFDQIGQTVVNSVKRINSDDSISQTDRVNTLKILLSNMWPPSMTGAELHRITLVSMRQITNAQHLRGMDATIFNLPSPTPRVALHQDHIDKVLSLWLGQTIQTSNIHNNISTQLIAGEWKTHPRHYQFRTDQRLYDLLTEIFPELSSIIPFQKFVELKPFFIVKGKFKYSLCEICRQLQLLLKVFAQMLLKYHPATRCAWA